MKNGKMAENSNSIHNLLHPDLMSKEEIIEILTLRCVKIENIEQLNRFELLNIYNRIVMPLEQRTSRQNGINKKTSQETNQDKKVCSSLPPCRKIKVNAISNSNLNEYDKHKKILKMSDDVSRLSLKRSIAIENDKPETSNKKLRQKITWP